MKVPIMLEKNHHWNTKTVVDAHFNQCWPGSNYFHFNLPVKESNVNSPLVSLHIPKPVSAKCIRYYSTAIS